jgi:hypothetical protein
VHFTALHGAALHGAALQGVEFLHCCPNTHPSISDRDCLFFLEKIDRRLLWSNPARRDALVSRMTTSSDMATRCTGDEREGRGQRWWWWWWTGEGRGAMSIQ